MSQALTIPPTTSTTFPTTSTTTTTMPSTPPMASPSASPPRTPIDFKPRTSNTTPNSDDSSIIDDLSFDYVFDNEGNYVRLSKGSSKSVQSSPPTPPDNLPTHQPDPPKPSPLQRRASLSRSESAYAALNVPPPDTAPGRSFQRVVSVPALVSNSQKRPFPRRVTQEDAKPRPLSGSGPPRPSRTTDISSYPHEKENMESDHDQLPPSKSSGVASLARILPARTGYARTLLADAQQRQILPGPNRAGRIMKSISFGLGLSKPIPESHSTAPDEFPSDHETEPGKFPPQVLFILSLKVAAEYEPPAPASTPLPSVDDLATLVNGGETEVIESKQKPYAALPNTTNNRDTPPVKEPGLGMSTGTRPRRSASLSDALSRRFFPSFVSSLTDSF